MPEFRAIAPLIVLNSLVPEFLDEVRRHIAIVHPMFVGVHCLVGDAQVTLRLSQYSILRLGIIDFYIDDGT